MDVLLVDNFYLKQKENISINIKETELARAGQTYLEYFLPERLDCKIFVLGREIPLA